MKIILKIFISFTSPLSLILRLRVEQEKVLKMNAQCIKIFCGEEFPYNVDTFRYLYVSVGIYPTMPLNGL